MIFSKLNLDVKNSTNPFESFNEHYISGKNDFIPVQHQSLPASFEIFKGHNVVNNRSFYSFGKGL
jgi:hypothetical protein